MPFIYSALLLTLLSLTVASSPSVHAPQGVSKKQGGVRLVSREIAHSSSLLEAKMRPPLSLNPVNPHYFLFRGKPTVLITSGEHYGAVLNLDFDYKTYLEELHKNGLNLTRTWPGSYREIPGSFGITENTLAPLPNRFICPWARSETPGASDGGNKFDLTRWNAAYFQRLRDFMTVASKHGIVVEMTLFCPNYEEALWKANPMHSPNNVNGVGECNSTEPYSLEHPKLLAVQDAMVRKIVAELAGFDNLYYEVCNEPYFGGVTMEWQRHIAQVIAEAERELPHKHLISLNIANEKAQVTDPDPLISIFNFHYATPPVVVGMNYGLNKVIGENETGFRGKADVLYRSEAWEFILAGGGLYNNLDYSFTASHPDGSLSDYKSPGGGSPALRSQLKILKTFLARFDFVRMAPNKAVVVGVPQGTRVEALIEVGKQYGIYLFGGKAESIQVDIPAGSYRIQWLDVITGKAVLSEARQHPGGIATLKVPPYVEDIAVSIRLK